MATRSGQPSPWLMGIQAASQPCVGMLPCGGGLLVGSEGDLKSLFREARGAACSSPGNGRPGKGLSEATIPPSSGARCEGLSPQRAVARARPAK